jgi:hypothetical protein
MPGNADWEALGDVITPPRYRPSTLAT